MGRTRVLALVAVIASASIVGAARPSGADTDPSSFMPCTYTSTLPAVNNASSPAINLPFPLNYEGQTYRSLYVNENGNVSFSQPESAVYPLTAAALSQAAVPPMIAPFFADVDTSAPGSGLVHYGFTTVGTGRGAPAFCVEWGDPGGNGVGYYNQHADKLDKFQLVLVSGRGGDFQAIFNYGPMLWDTGDAVNGQPGVPAGAGFTGAAGADVYRLVKSNQPDGLIGNPLSMRHGQNLGNQSYGSTVSGRFVFSLTNGLIPRPTASIGPASFVEGDAGTIGYARAIPVTLSYPSAAPVTVYYTVTIAGHNPRAATPGPGPNADFLAVTTPQPLSFQKQTPKQVGVSGTTAFIPLTIYGDTRIEGDEQFVVNLTSATGAALDPMSQRATMTILNDDPAPAPGVRLGVSSATIAQGDQVAAAGGTNQLPFNFVLSQPNPGPGDITVTYDLKDGTAVAGTDYTMIGSPTVTFAPGSQVQTVLVGIYPNATFTTTKTFTLEYSGLGSGTATGTIVRHR